MGTCSSKGRRVDAAVIRIPTPPPRQPFPSTSKNKDSINSSRRGSIESEEATSTTPIPSKSRDVDEESEAEAAPFRRACGARLRPFWPSCAEAQAGDIRYYGSTMVVLRWYCGGTVVALWQYCSSTARFVGLQLPLLHTFWRATHGHGRVAFGITMS